MVVYVYIINANIYWEKTMQEWWVERTVHVMKVMFLKAEHEENRYPDFAQNFHAFSSVTFEGMIKVKLMVLDGRPTWTCTGIIHTCSIVGLIFWVQVRLRTEVLCTLSSTWQGFEMTSRSWQYTSCHWDACSNYSAVSDFSWIEIENWSSVWHVSRDPYETVL